ncbi:MAG TPA: hypothetical protein VEA59_04400 [Patescibacteria group bacterium]|nr:hypothetical protein [Patescibacteria group bacterium]
MGRIIQNNLVIPLPPKNQTEFFKRMRPSKTNPYGFMGKTEDWVGLLTSDERERDRLRITCEQMASAIDTLFATDELLVNGNHIQRILYLTGEMCPWGDFCSTALFDLTPKVTEILVCNKTAPEAFQTHFRNGLLTPADYRMIVQNNWAIILSDLHPHLLREHEFQEGKQTPYRIDPRKLKEYLGF